MDIPLLFHNSTEKNKKIIIIKKTCQKAHYSLEDTSV